MPSAEGPPGVPVPCGEAAAPPVTLAVDIETTGLEKDCAITCVCAWDGRAGRTWFFRDAEEALRSGREVKHALDAAALLLAFNGAKFDLPILARVVGDPTSLGAWMAKLVDPFYAAAGVLGPGATMNLNSFLALNGLQCKSGSGARAVEMAHAGQWEALGSYCMDDARLAYQAITSRGAWDRDLGIRFDPWHPSQTFIRETPHQGGEQRGPVA